MDAIDVSVEVAVPLTVAYDHFADFERFPDFMEGVEDLVQIDETHVHWRTLALGVAQEFDTEITEQRPGEKIAWRAATGARGHSGVARFTSVEPGRTRIELAIEFDDHRGAEAVALHRRRVTADLERFRAMVESAGRRVS